VQQPQAGLEIKTSFFAFWFTLFLFPPKISIDGSPPIPGKWGDNLIPVGPGRHSITVWWPLYWFIPANKATVTVDVAQGQVAQIHYMPAAWPLFFFAGRIQQTGVRGMQGQAAAQAVGQGAAGWHPDPAGRHELRYWNGTGWTDDVSDAGVAAKDPAG